MNKELIAEIERRSTPEPNTGCWLWDAASTKGYGKFGGQGAHRTSYEAHKGKIPKGKFVLHKCDTPACVNPAHLFTGTQKENLKDMANKGRAFTPFKKKTHCLRGHELNEKTAYIYGKSKTCKLCKKMQADNYYLTKRKPNYVSKATKQ